VVSLGLTGRKSFLLVSAGADTSNRFTRPISLCSRLNFFITCARIILRVALSSSLRPDALTKTKLLPPASGLDILFASLPIPYVNRNRYNPLFQRNLRFSRASTRSFLESKITIIGRPCTSWRVPFLPSTTSRAKPMLKSLRCRGGIWMLREPRAAGS
jgi:hypothetical protein